MNVPNHEVLEEGLYFAPMNFGLAAAFSDSLDETFAEYKKAMADHAEEVEGTPMAALLHSMGTSALDGSWPPEPAYRFKLKAIARAINQAAEKAQVKIDRNVALLGGDIFQMSITPGGQLVLDWDTIKNERLTFTQLEAVLLKNIGLYKQGSMQGLTNIHQALSVLGPLDYVARFYDEDPERVQQQIEEHYGSVAEFRKKLGEMYGAVRPFLSHAASVPDYGQLDANQALAHKAKHPEVFARLNKPGTVQMTSETMEILANIGLAFAPQMNRILVEHMRKLGQDPGYMEGMSQFDTPKREVSAQGAQELREVMDEFVRPALPHVKN